MPLVKSGSREAVSRNIRQLRADKYPRRQAIAIALDIQRRAKRKKYAEGGTVDDLPNPAIVAGAMERGRQLNRADRAYRGVENFARGIGDLVTAPVRIPQQMRALDPMSVPEEFADMTWQERLVAQSALERERADWGAGMGAGMIGMARLPSGSVGSGAARLGSGPNGQWVPILDNAEVYKMLAQKKRDQGIGTGTQRTFETREQMEKTQRPRTDWELAVAKARAGLQGDAKMAAHDFAEAVRPYAGPTHLERVWPADPPPLTWRPEVPPNVLPGPGMTARESMSLADLLRTFGIAGIPAAGVAGAALSQEKPGMKHGGAIALARRINRASGGAIDMPFAARSAARNLERSGLIRSPTAGRADKVAMGVRGGSHVIPADIVSGIGQGNTSAGALALNRLFKMAPGGAEMPHPRAMKMPTGGMMRGRRGFADGGDTGEDVDVAVSGGEFLVPANVVLEIGGGDQQHGHDILDAMIEQIRAKTIRALKRLPGPRK